MLYHYTSIEKLRNILETQQIWLTKISDYDDIFEFNHTISLVSKELPVPFDDLLSEVTKINNLIFVSCFCSDFDRSYLWRNYGEFNIEFSQNVLMSMVDYQQRAYGYITANSAFLRCKYCSEGQEAFIRKAFKRSSKGNGYSIPVDTLSHLATIFKKSDFCPEQETRLVLYLKAGSPIETLEYGDKKVNYFVLPFQTNDGSQPIKSITIGPTSRLDEVERDLRAFLNKQKLGNVAIKHSKISYEDFSKFQSIEQTNGCDNCEYLLPNQ